MPYESEKVLQEIGFSKAESLVYITLLKTGSTKSGKIIKKTGLQSSVIHNTLNSLVDKGFVTYVLEGKVKKYEAVSPEIITDYLDSKKSQFQNILPELEILKSKSLEKHATVKIYEGFKGLMTANFDMVKEKQKGDYKYFAAEEILLTKETMEFFEKIDLIKKSMKINVKGIANAKEKNILKNYKNSVIIYTNLDIPPAMNIYGDKILMVSLSDKPIGILIESKEIAQQYHRMWDNIWKNSLKGKS